MQMKCDKQYRSMLLLTGLLASPALWANQNDDAFRDYINSVVCNDPQGDLVVTCNAAATTVGGSGGSLSQTGNVGTQGVNELSTKEATNKAKLSQQEQADASRVQLQRWGIFSNVDYRNLDRDNTLIEDGYDGNTVALTMGVDYRATNRMLMGIALSYGDTTLNDSDDAATLDITSYEMIAFANYQLTDWLYVDGYIGSVHQRNDNNRSVNFGLIQYEATSEFDSANTQWRVGVGYQAGYQYMALDVSLHVDVSQVDIDRYTETGGDSIENLNLRYDAQTIDSKKVVLTVNSAFNISLASGVMVPYVRADAVNELETDPHQITSHLVVAPDEDAFVAVTDKPDGGYVTLGAGVQYLQPGGWLFYLDAENLVGHDYLNIWRMSAGLRLEL